MNGRNKKVNKASYFGKVRRSKGKGSVAHFIAYSYFQTGKLWRNIFCFGNLYVVINDLAGSIWVRDMNCKFCKVRHVYKSFQINGFTIFRCVKKDIANLKK